MYNWCLVDGQTGIDYSECGECIGQVEETKTLVAEDTTIIQTQQISTTEQQQTSTIGNQEITTTGQRELSTIDKTKDVKKSMVSF